MAQRGVIRSALIGAFVADAANLGLHWVYDPEHLDKLSAARGGALEFFPVGPDEHAGRGYFAHAAKTNGDLTQYGAQLLSSLDAIATEPTIQWSPNVFLSKFKARFGPGGEWVGYVDGCTSGTIENLALDAAKVAKDAAEHVGVTGVPASYIIKYIPKKAETHSGAALQDEIEGVIKMRFDGRMDKPEEAALDIPRIRQQARDAAVYFEANVTRSPGADDNQISAFAKIPGVVAALVAQGTTGPAFAAAVEAAVRVTNNNDEAVEYTLYAATVLQRVLLGTTIGAALRDALAAPEVAAKLSDAAKKKLTKALDGQYSTATPAELAKAFGMPCPMVHCIPLSVALLNRPSIEGLNAFVLLNRLNIAAGGDNAGRAVFIGAVLGAAHGVGTDNGVPLSWLVQLNEAKAVTKAIDRVFA